MKGPQEALPHSCPGCSTLYLAGVPHAASLCQYLPLLHGSQGPVSGSGVGVGTGRGQSAVCQLSSLCSGDWLVCPLVTRGGKLLWALSLLLPLPCGTFCLWLGPGVESPLALVKVESFISKLQCVCGPGGPRQGLHHSGGTENVVAHSGIAS